MDCLTVNFGMVDFSTCYTPERWVKIMTMNRHLIVRPAGVAFAVVFSMFLAMSIIGCVEREMTITSEPAGALVFVSDVEIGRTPVTIPFTWYGDYDIILRHDGYETKKTHAKINPPIYEIPPLDLFSAIAPWTYHDRRYLHYKMDTLVLPSDEELVKQAEALQKRNLEPEGK